MILQKNSIESISQLFNLPYTGIEQDWDIEMATPSRIDEFIRFYPRLDLTNSEKSALMALIFASYDELLKENMLECEIWKKIKFYIQKEKELFQELVDYWALPNEQNIDNLFNITPITRKLRRELYMK